MIELYASGYLRRFGCKPRTSGLPLTAGMQTSVGWSRRANRRHVVGSASELRYPILPNACRCSHRCVLYLPVFEGEPSERSSEDQHRDHDDGKQDNRKDVVVSNEVLDYILNALSVSWAYHPDAPPFR